MPAAIADARVAGRCPGFGVGPCAQFSAFARIRASEVLPVPRGPAKRYAWRTCPRVIAFAQRADDRLLADDLVEVLRPVLAVERGHPPDNKLR